MLFLELEDKHYVGNFLRYVKNLIENNHKSKFEPQNSILLVGSNMKIENRILSSKFCKIKQTKLFLLIIPHTPFIYTMNQ